MQYHINVAHNGKFFFRTEGLALTKEEALELYATIKAKFPRSEGYTTELRAVKQEIFAISDLSDTSQKNISAVAGDIIDVQIAEPLIDEHAAGYSLDAAVRISRAAL